MELFPSRRKTTLAERLHGRPKKIYVFENGDRFTKCISPVINPNVLKSWKNILLHLTEKMQPSFGTIQNIMSLKTMENATCFDDLEVEEKYVALGPNSQYVSLKYLTPEEKKLKKKKCAGKRFYKGEVDPSKKKFFEETEKRGLTVIFVVPNGGKNQEPKKFVFSMHDLEDWNHTLLHIAKSLDIDGLINLSTIFGDNLTLSCQLQHGFLYVAVPYNEEFVSMDYARLFNQWGSPSAFRLRIMPADQKGIVQFNLDPNPAEEPPKKLSMSQRRESDIEYSQSILKVADNWSEENLVLPEGITLHEDAMITRVREMRDSIVLARISSSRDLLPGMLAKPAHLNECAPHFCELCDPKGTECPECEGECETEISCNPKYSTERCPGECDTPCHGSFICCPMCNCIIKIPSQEKKKVKCSKTCEHFQKYMEACPECKCADSKGYMKNNRRSLESEQSGKSEQSAESKNSADISNTSERRDSTESKSSTDKCDTEEKMVSEESENSTDKSYTTDRRNSADSKNSANSNFSITGVKVPIQENSKTVKGSCSANCENYVKEGTSCSECKCDSSKKDTGVEIHKADLCNTYRKHGTPCLICECTHKHNQFNKTPSLRLNSPARHSKERLCDSDCEYFLKTGVQYPDCKCNEVQNLLQLVILEAQTIVERCDTNDCSRNIISCKTTIDEDSQKGPKRSKSKEKHKMIDGPKSSSRSKSPPKTKRCKSKEEQDKLTKSCSSSKAESPHRSGYSTRNQSPENVTASSGKKVKSATDPGCFSEDRNQSHENMTCWSSNKIKSSKTPGYATEDGSGLSEDSFQLHDNIKGCVSNKAKSIKKLGGHCMEKKQSATKSNRKKADEHQYNILTESSTKKTPPPKAPVKKKKDVSKDKKSCKRTMSSDSLDVKVKPKKIIEHNARKSAKKKTDGSPGMKKDNKTKDNKAAGCRAGECSTNKSPESERNEKETKKIASECVEPSKATAKCASMNTLDRIPESCSKTTDTTSEAEVDCGCSEDFIKPDQQGKSYVKDTVHNTQSTTVCSKICVAPSTCETMEDIHITKVAVEIDEQHSCCQSVTKIRSEIRIVSQSSKTPSLKAVTFSSLAAYSESCFCDENRCLEEHQAPSTFSECHEEETKEELVEQYTEEVDQIDDQQSNGSCAASNDPPISGSDHRGKLCECLLPCHCIGEFGEFCHCDNPTDDPTGEPPKYILICDNTCDHMKKTGSPCPTCGCDDSNDEEELVGLGTPTCERSVEADLREVPGVDQHTQVGESCVCLDHEPHSEVCMKNVCYEYCGDDVHGNMSADSLESTCVVKPVREDMKLVTKPCHVSLEDVYQASQDKKTRYKEGCCYVPNEPCIQGISIQSKMNVNFYGLSGTHHHGWHYSKTKKYKKCGSSVLTFLSETSTAESDRRPSDCA